VAGQVVGGELVMGGAGVVLGVGVDQRGGQPWDLVQQPMLGFLGDLVGGHQRRLVVDHHLALGPQGMPAVRGPATAARQAGSR
jgi:hypothetical protein